LARIIKREMPMPRRLGNGLPRFLYHSLLAAGLAAVACAEAHAGDTGGGMSSAVPFVMGGVIMVGIVAAGWLVLGSKLPGWSGGPVQRGGTPAPATVPGQPGEGPLTSGPWAEPPDVKRGPNPIRQLVLPGILVAAAIAGAVPGFLYIKDLASAPSRMQKMVTPPPTMSFPRFDFNKDFYKPVYGPFAPPQQDLPVVVQPLGPAVPSQP
jgi:hypothetical protein